MVKKYEDLLKENKKIINVVGKQGELLKRFKDEEEFFECVGLCRSNIYLYKYLGKLPLLKNSTLTSSHFKNNSKVIKKVFKANVDMFGE